MNWQWLHRWSSPRWFYQHTSWVSYLMWLSLTLLLGIGSWAVAFTPVAVEQGQSFRIIFVHVPTAVVSMAAYYVMAFAGAIGLIWKSKLAHLTMHVCAPIGAVFTALALFTGAVWGKPTWGTWWVWDARLTSVLILLFLYLGMIALQNAFENRALADKSCAILALVGSVNIPIIYKSVDWWFTLHQPASIRLSGSSIDEVFLYPLLAMIGTCYLIFIASLLAALRTEIVDRNRQALWVRELVER